MANRSKNKNLARTTMMKLISCIDRAARNAQLENWSYGLPNIYSFDGRLYYALPNGRMLTEEEYKKEFPASAE